MISDRPVFFKLSPPAVYGENWGGGNLFIFLEKLAREPHSNLIFAVFVCIIFLKIRQGNEQRSTCHVAPCHGARYACTENHSAGLRVCKAGTEEVVLTLWSVKK